MKARERLVREADQWRGSGGTGRFTQLATLVAREHPKVSGATRFAPAGVWRRMSR
jgi:hypothetical protein